MFRLTALLGAGIYLAMLVGGVDRGQHRFGLMAPPEKVRPAIVAAAEPAAPAVVQPQVQPAAFVPSAPVMVTPAVEVAPPEAQLPDAPAEAAVVVQYINTNANLREGPGTDFAVLARLSAGEAVQVVEALPDGWSNIRIEGDGGEGFVATRLLSQ
jgi:uncharacterized protein YgiM (DUF1202 family)